MIDLSISIRPDAGTPAQLFRLVAREGRPAPGTTLPDPEAALAAVQQFGEAVFFPAPGPPRLCTQQYGGPQVAVVTGTIDGRAVNTVFTRTDGCEIARWNAMAALLAGGTAA